MFANIPRATHFSSDNLLKACCSGPSPRCRESQLAPTGAIHTPLATFGT